MSTEPVTQISVDLLEEDPIIPSQQYCVVSYAFSSDTDKTGQKLPIFKIRGSYRSLEECQKRTTKLLDIDPECIPILTTEVGKWMGLFPIEELQKNTDIDVHYRDSRMQEVMDGLRKSTENAANDFWNRVQNDVKKAEAKKEGKVVEDSTQQPERENAISVYGRHAHYCEEVVQLQNKLATAEKYKEEAYQLLITEYSEEEIKEAKEKVNELRKNSTDYIKDHIKVNKKKYNGTEGGASGHNKGGKRLT
jgi:hypothetical protein